MGLFGNSEEKERKKLEAEKAKKELRYAQFELSRTLIETTEGKYFAKMFSTSEFGKSNAMAAEKLFKEIAEFANYFDLEIKHIGKLEDDALKLLGINVMFEKR